jgi:hypothetical protein
MRLLFRLSLGAIIFGLLPLALAMIGLGMDAVLGCVNPPFAAPMTGGCGVAERLINLIWSARLTLPLTGMGVLGLLVWTARLLKNTRD